MKISQPIYDREEVAPEAITLAFFQKSLGSRRVGATLKDRTKAPVGIRPSNQCDTNMDTKGVLASPRPYWITGLSFVPANGSSIDQVDRYMANSWGRLHIGKRDHLVLPMQFLYQHADRFDVNKPVYQFPGGIRLLPQQPFRVEINTPRPINKVRFDLYSVLHGYWNVEDPEPIPSPGDS